MINWIKFLFKKKFGSASETIQYSQSKISSSSCRSVSNETVATQKKISNSHSFSISELNSIILSFEKNIEKFLASLKDNSFFKETESNKNTIISIREMIVSSNLSLLLKSKIIEYSAKYLEISISLSREIVKIGDIKKHISDAKSSKKLKQHLSFLSITSWKSLFGKQSKKKSTHKQLASNHLTCEAQSNHFGISSNYQLKQANMVSLHECISQFLVNIIEIENILEQRKKDFDGNKNANEIVNELFNDLDELIKHEKLVIIYNLCLFAFSYLFIAKELLEPDFANLLCKYAYIFYTIFLILNFKIFPLSITS